MKNPPLSDEHARHLAHAEALCREHNATLLFLTLFGSTLYGTASAGTSDVDIRGVFLPSVASLVLNEATEGLHTSTADHTQRNAAQDVDMDLCSLQHWLLHLVPEGDIGGLDLLFAPSNPACTLYRSPALDAVFGNPLKLVNTAAGRACADYCLKQTRKYGIKGSRAGALRRVWHWLETHPVQDFARLQDCMDDIVQLCGDERFCRPLETREGRGLILGTRTHMGSLRMGEFARRVQGEMERFGARALDAERNEGIDFKALSHAMRALYQMEELLLTGQIVFPLQRREELLTIKQGDVPWSELEPLILDHLRTLETLRTTTLFTSAYDPVFARQCILSAYNLSNSHA